MPGTRLIAKIRNAAPINIRADAEVVIVADAFHAQESEQVQSGQSEQHDPNSQESLTRDDVPLQHLVDRAEIFQTDRKNDESQYDLHASQPTAAARHSLQERRK